MQQRLPSRNSSEILETPRPPMFEVTYYGTRIAKVRRVQSPENKVISQYTIRCRGMHVPFQHIRRDGCCTLYHRGEYLVITPTPEFWREHG